MQNLIQIEDDIKGLPDQALQMMAQRPNPQVPQYLVVSEIQRRSDMRKRFEAQQNQPMPTVAQQIVSQQPQGIASVMQNQQPQQAMPMQNTSPRMQGMAAGGVVRMAEGRQATFPIDETPEISSIIGQRINNPFNIRQANQDFLGETGEESGFVSFESSPFGVRAADKVLTTYGRDYGINTIRGLINRFAPPSENDTRGYINYISSQLGIDPDAEIDLSDPDLRSRILSPMAMLESRTELTPDQIQQQIAEANQRQVTPPVAQVDIPDLDLQFPRETVITTEEIDPQKNPQKQGPRTPTELMNEYFPDSKIESGIATGRQGAVSRMPELVNRVEGSRRGGIDPTTTNVDLAGLTTIEGSPKTSVIEDAEKAIIGAEIADTYTPMQGKTIKMPTAPVTPMSREERLLAMEEGFSQSVRPDEDPEDIVIKDRYSDLLTTRGERKRQQEREDLEEKANQAASQAERAAAAEAAQMQENQDAREKNINEAQAYLDKVKEDKAAGVISDEEAAKKEALAFALVQLGAGIAKGDLAEGLQKAGETASEIRKDAKDRAIRQEYYDSIAGGSKKGTRMDALLSKLSTEVNRQMKALTSGSGLESIKLTNDPVAQSAEKRRITASVAAELGIPLSTALNYLGLSVEGVDGELPDEFVGSGQMGRTVDFASLNRGEFGG
tara:strand:- start:214 stop:2220 length:2007 start_codon:yes stop_codon:yes gene_type:complete